jgi:hypothetical protein
MTRGRRYYGPILMALADDARYCSHVAFAVGGAFFLGKTGMAIHSRRLMTTDHPCECKAMQANTAVYCRYVACRVPNEMLVFSSAATQDEMNTTRPH